MSLKSKIQALITAANTTTGESATDLTGAVQDLVDGYGGITPSGSVTLTEENTYDVTDKAQAIVDFSATRADLAEAVTAKGVDTLPTASFDTIATNIGLIEGGGGDSVVKYTTVVESLAAEDTIYNILTANPYKCYYKESMVEVFIFSNVGATSGSDYVNNKYYLYHNGTSLGGRMFNQLEQKSRTASAMLTNENFRGNQYTTTATIDADGGVKFRTSSDTIMLAVGSKVVVVEIPFNDNLTKFGET